MRTTGLIIGFISLAMWSCKTIPVSSSIDTYREDLSGLRSALTVTEEVVPSEENTSLGIHSSETAPTGHIKAELDSVSTIITEQNKALRYVDGYTIQVYTGSNREDALLARSKVRQVNADLKPSIQYHQPNYKVKVGQYVDRLKAHEIFESSKESSLSPFSYQKESE